MHKFAKTANTFVLVISVLVILLVVNFLVARHLIWRIDLTGKGLYSLSASSKKIVGNLNDLVTVKAYFSSKLPPYLSNLRQDVGDLLKEYQAFSKGNLRVQFIDPADNDELKRKLMYDGIPPINLQTIDKHKYEVMEAYFGITINYEDRKETIPIVNPETLEYDLSAAIKKVSTPKPPVVGLLTNRKDIDIDKDYDTLKRDIQKLYEVRTVTPTEGEKIPQSIDVLLLLAPDDFSDAELFEIDQFVMRGGKLICLADGINLDERTLQASAKKPNIARILSHYGLQLNDDLIEDFRSNAMASFSTRFMRTMVNYPFWVKVARKYFNPESPITKRLMSLVLPWASSVSRSEKVPDGVKITTLASTTKNGYEATAPFNLNPFSREQPKLTREDLKQYDLALLAEGEFPSAFKGEKIPEVKPEVTSDEKDKRPPRGTIEKERKDKSEKTSVLLVGNSRFVRDNYLYSTRAKDENLSFLDNAIDNMAIGKDLIGIRTRESAERPLRIDLTDAQKTTYKWLAILGVPVLIIIFALIRIPWIRSRRRYYEAILSKE